MDMSLAKFFVVCFLQHSSGFYFGTRPRLSTQIYDNFRKYPLSSNYYEESLRRLNSRNTTIRESEILDLENQRSGVTGDTNETATPNPEKIRIIIGRNGIRGLPGIGQITFNPIPLDMNGNSDGDEEEDDDSFESFKRKKSKKSKNFEVITDFPVKFADVGGYDNIKSELAQCVDILSNYTKYTAYNVRIPKGLIFEGPPGNGKTLLAKALAGEAGIPFIPVSGSQFQDKYVGVGSSRIRELFDLAKKHAPVIIFIDEIDALGRKRSGDGETASSERDNTLNELLVAMDGFKNNTGVFIVGATNRADLLDPALLRPGRIDKRIYITNPDAKTREAIIRIHTKGKPYEAKISVADMVDMTAGLSGAQIENLMNEAMLNALRLGRTIMTADDIDYIMNKMMVGWQPNEHTFTSDIIDHIAVHELGHAIVGLLSKHHAKMSKVVINLSAPRSPAYTVFEASEQPIFTREALFEHLMILLGGRIAEEVVYNVSVTTGAMNDFEEALKLAEKMVLYYGMGNISIYPSRSEKYLAIIDDEVSSLIQEAYQESFKIIERSKDFILEASEMLKRENILHASVLEKMIRCKYSYLLNK